MNESMSTEEAQQALAETETVAKATRLAAALAGADLVVMMWGLIWLAGFLWSHWVTVREWPNWSHGAWFLIIAAGVISTIMIEKRREAPVKNTTGKRIGFFWFFLYLYCYLGLAILGPSLDAVRLNSTVCGAKTMAALNTVVPMFAYVVMGLWLEQSYFVYIGLGLTALTGVAFFAFNPIFFPLMAFAGGGILFGSGVWMRIRWTRAMKEVGNHAKS